mmetsp:Transcript_85328/g.268960  ORF Transcript_85328/g.268960 Transcript_85328/m.268960 type:complete len:411 (-) Transcript_85328:10-1242(-)
MPLDKARIQGIGSDGPAPPKPPECPGGHELQLWAARSGKCDGCHKKVQTGELVMDCRRCNWYLCNICCPQNKSQESSVWGALSSLPFYVLDDMAEMASDIETFVSASVFDQDKDADGQGKAGSQDTPVSPRQKAESIQMVSQFCEKYPAVRVVPNEVDLDVFWTRCSVLQPKPVADAIYEQLSFSGGDIEWQPRLRALYALEHLHQKGGTGKDISKMVMHSAKELLQHLVDVPQCSQKAQHVIAVLKGAKPPEAPAPKAQAGSSAGPAAAEPKSAASSAPAASSSSPAKPKAAAQKPTDLLDLAPASVPPPPKVVGGTPADLLDLQMPASGSTGPRGQGVGDLLDLAAHPGLAAAAPLVTPAPAPAPAPSTRLTGRCKLLSSTRYCSMSANFTMYSRSLKFIFTCFWPLL